LSGISQEQVRTDDRREEKSDKQEKEGRHVD
jgi:hypothetical protein